MTKKEAKAMEDFLIKQVKETVNLFYKDITYDKSFKFELEVRYNKKKNETTVKQGFNNG